MLFVFFYMCSSLRVVFRRDVRKHGEDLVTDTYTSALVPLMQLKIDPALVVVARGTSRILILAEAVARIVFRHPFLDEVGPVRRAIFQAAEVLLFGQTSRKVCWIEEPRSSEIFIDCIMVSY